MKWAHLLFLNLALIMFGHMPGRADDPTTYSVKTGAAPWSDRAGVWQLTNIPSSVDGNGPYAQGNCGSRSLTVPDGTKSILIGVSEADVPKFLADFADAKATGESFMISHSDGTGTLSYTIFKMINPPATIQAKDTTQPYGAGLILLQLGEKTASSTSASKPASGTTK